MVKIDNTKIADLGFYINLNKRTDRNKILSDHLKEFNIIGVERHAANESTDCGQLNLVKSNYEIYEKFLQTDAETLLILEDDCKFLPQFKKESTTIFKDIHNTDWDIFWLGCVNRKSPIYYKNNCYKVSSISYSQSYLIKRDICKHILDNMNGGCFGKGIDELLCLYVYGQDVAYDPNKYNFYNLEQPLEVLPTVFTSLCYKYVLSTQYNSYSDLSWTEKDLEDWLCNHHPEKYNSI